MIAKRRADQPIINRDEEIIYKVGSAVPEDGFYICVPCGSKKYLRASTRFRSCLICLGKERKLFRRGRELWKRILDKKVDREINQ